MIWRVLKLTSEAVLVWKTFLVKQWIRCFNSGKIVRCSKLLRYSCSQSPAMAVLQHLQGCETLHALTSCKWFAKLFLCKINKKLEGSVPGFYFIISTMLNPQELYPFKNSCIHVHTCAYICIHTQADLSTLLCN